MAELECGTPTIPNVGFIVTLTFEFLPNVSLQVGDSVYWNSVSNMGGGFEGGSDVPHHFGYVTEIITGFSGKGSGGSSSQILVMCPYWDTSISAPFPRVLPLKGSFISFTKNKIVNNNNLLGYYASVGFRNNSKTRTAELFSVGSEVSESSK